MKDLVIRVNNIVLYCLLSGTWGGSVIVLFIAGFLPALGML
ncbi:hypothetical protein ACNFBR_20575 [Pseudomonas sp. NY11955]